GSVSRRELAPGAEEFQPPSTGMWLPPGRTFSPASVRAGFQPERVEHVEIAAEQPLDNDIVIGVRAFRQEVDNQIATLFGLSLPNTAGASLGHYYIANAGDADIRGWGLSLSRTVVDGVRASVDYTQADADWIRGSTGLAAVALVTPSVSRRRSEQIRDL